MTENDDRLIEEALSIPYFNWEHVTPLIEKADTEEARLLLRDIRKNYAYREEYASGLDGD